MCFNAEKDFSAQQTSFTFTSQKQWWNVVSSFLKGYLVVVTDSLNQSIYFHNFMLLPLYHEPQ